VSNDGTFSKRLLTWFDKHGRHDLPWQHPRAAYRVWLSEIMLQQTQVATVIPYFERFLARFPDIAALAASKPDEVLRLWAGLGYYARARNLHKAAQTIVADHGGKFPRDFESVANLPGIGRSTAGAILAQAFGQRHAILDGNARRVLARHGAIAGWPGEPAVQKKLWTLAEQGLPQTRLADYTQAIMDLGASICTARNPACLLCPVSADCVAHATGKVHDYPAPRPRRERPQRKTQMLLIENASGDILLERRPPAGIWGGLWCLPMLDAGSDGRGYLRDRFSLDADQAEALPVVHHGFTHFDLEITPLRLRTQALPAVEESAQRAWTRMDALSALGLPAPVKKLLQTLASTNPSCPAPSTASSSASKPKASTGRPTRARSASASSSKSPSRRGANGSSSRRA
jgi:A/G-specific adenine glycosylase